MNAASGKLLAQGSNPECWQKFTRPGLARHLILEAQRMHGDSIRFHFGKVSSLFSQLPWCGQSLSSTL